MTPPDPTLDLGTALLQGHDMIAESIAVHDARWGMSGADSWSLDQREGRVVWTFEQHTVSADAQILGSWNSAAGSFVWAWDNESILEPLCEVSERVRAYGAEHDVFALTASPLALDETRVRDLVALAFRVGGCTGFFHPTEGDLTSYVVFGEVRIEFADGVVEEFEVRLP